MSFLKELQLQHGVLEVPHVSLEEIDISLEGLSLSKIKELVVKGVNKVIEFFTKIFKWIKEKVLTFLKSKRTNKVIEKAKIINNIEKEVIKGASFGGYGDTKDNKLKIDKNILNDLYSDNDIEVYIESFFDIYSRQAKNYNLSMLFTEEGKLTDITKIYAYLNKTYEKINDVITMIESDINNKDLDDILENSDKFFDNQIIDMRAILYTINDDEEMKKGSRSDVYYSSDVISKITKNELFKWTENNYFEKIANETEEFYKKKEKNVSKLIEKFKKELRTRAFGMNANNDEDLSESVKTELIRKRKIINYLYSYLRVLAIPSMVCSTYIQLLDYICNKFSSKEYLIDPNPPKYKHLYHLSDDDRLTSPVRSSKILTPLIPQSGIFELLPPRISFAEDVISCCFGVEKYFKDTFYQEKAEKDPSYDPKKGLWRDLYLYEGIQTSETEFIKPIIIQAFIGDYRLTNEICVLNKIRINKVGKVRIWYNPHLPIQDDRKFINWTFIEDN